MTKKESKRLEFENVIPIRKFNSSPSKPKTKSSRLNQAQDLIYDAWDFEKKKDRIELAREALNLSEDCADAWNILAEDSVRSPVRKLYYYEKGLEAAKRALGEDYFKNHVGHFWGAIESRPFMRSLAGYSLTLWKLGQ